MLRIAVAGENGQVSNHFGHCQKFIIFDTEDSRIIQRETLVNPGHKPGFLPQHLADRGVNVVISGGMGQGAADYFNEKEIQVIVGAKGEADKAVEAYLRGSLCSTNSICHEHQHRGDCKKKEAEADHCGE